MIENANIFLCFLKQNPARQGLKFWRCQSTAHRSLTPLSFTSVKCKWISEDGENNGQWGSIIDYANLTLVAQGYRHLAAAHGALFMLVPITLWKSRKVSGNKLRVLNGLKDRWPNEDLPIQLQMRCPYGTNGCPVGIKSMPFAQVTLLFTTRI